MRQIILNINTGKTEIVNVPIPVVEPGKVLIRSTRTLVSTGSERMLIDFSKGGWIAKARQQPEKVKQAINKIRTDGLLPTIETIRSRLNDPIRLGYCNTGIVIKTGERVDEYVPGDRVVSNGFHAEFVCVPKNLCAKIPEGVSDDEASFAVLGSIALQGVRLTMPTFGEKFMVFGLGLVGLIAVQILKACGCYVLAIDVNSNRLNLAKLFGADIVDLQTGADPVSAALEWTNAQGVDGVVIAASAKGDKIIHQAALACRKRGRIILVGVVDLKLSRSDFYEKELSFRVSCSYGPGRYDETYEQKGLDYPIGYVRWTEQRNMQAVLAAMKSGQIHVKELITNRLKIEEANNIYKSIIYDPDALAIIIEYDGAPQYVSGQDEKTVQIAFAPKKIKLSNSVNEEIKIGVIGAGNFAKTIILPMLSKIKANINVIADIDGVAALCAARKFKIGKVVADYKEIIDDPEIKAVFILVGHHLHSKFICESLEARKHVFVEKPLAINIRQLQDVIETHNKIISETIYDDTTPLLMVGFNRRFSSHIVKIKDLIKSRSGPLTINMVVNAGIIAQNHWIHDPERGGGRIIGEGCHFIDLLSYLTDSPVKTVSAQMVGKNASMRDDKITILLNFSDGTIGTIHYYANGAKSYPKEVLEIFGDGRVIRSVNYRVTKGYGYNNFNSFRTWRQDKGHRQEVVAFFDTITKGGQAPIAISEIVNVTKASFAAVEAARNNKIISLF